MKFPNPFRRKARVKKDELPREIAALYPFERHYFVLPDGTRMHYVDEGEGDVIVMLHGNPTWSFMYRNIILALSGKHRCIVPDHVGCGLSDKPENHPYTLASHAWNVRLLLDSLGVEHYSLVAHDWGGAIGMCMASQLPVAPDRIVLMNTAAFASMRIPLRIAVCKVPLLGDLIIRGMNAFAGGAVRMAVSRRLPREVRKGFLWPYRTWRDRIANLRFVQDIPLFSWHPSYRTLKDTEAALPRFADVPILLCWGLKDWCFSPHYLARWMKIYPRARVRAFRGAGHYVFEDAGDEVVGTISAFMDEKGTDPQ
jgi:haloalkane dehalogenase